MHENHQRFGRLIFHNERLDCGVLVKSQGLTRLVRTAVLDIVVREFSKRHPVGFEPFGCRSGTFMFGVLGHR